MRNESRLAAGVLAGVLWISGASGALAAQADGGSAQALGAAPCQETLAQLYRRVSPSVVLINASSINPYDIDHRIQRVSGSGVIFDKSGLIVTNSHVVFGRQIITVALDNGAFLTAQLVGADPVFDIAVIRIQAPASGDLPVARFGDSDRLDVGHEVYAIGNPLGLNQTLTRGIVSAVNRMLPGPSFSLTEPLIQTDAAINPGNSGGPLVDRCGDVAGITTAVVPDAQNIGFAVPVNLVKGILPALMRDGRVIRSWVGVQGQFVVPALKELLRIPLADGFLVEAVEPGSPAEKADIQDGEFELTIGGQPILLGGDIITELNGSSVDGPGKLESALKSVKIGDTLRMAVFRDSKTLRIDVVVTERPILPSDLPGRRVGNPLGAVPLTGGPIAARKAVIRF
ncbi:MAG TPA: trypsin-like peptidase domain-containing protein [Vicinamibacterales bacterium]